MRETVGSCGPLARCCSVQTESSSASYDSSATDQPRAVLPIQRFAETPRSSFNLRKVCDDKTLFNQKPPAFRSPETPPNSLSLSLSLKHPSYQSYPSPPSPPSHHFSPIISAPSVQPPSHNHPRTKKPSGVKTPEGSYFCAHQNARSHRLQQLHINLPSQITTHNPSGDTNQPAEHRESFSRGPAGA